MTITPTGVFATRIAQVTTGGIPEVLIYGPILGGIILNPASNEDQGIAEVEVLYIDVVGDATLGVAPTTQALQPGQIYYVPKNQTTNVSVNAASSGHKFSAITFQPTGPIIPADLVGMINPCLTILVPSYLYQQYANDDDLQAFVAAYNGIAQQYLSWMSDVSLPVYTGPLIIGNLLDWVARGLYGLQRPVLSAGNMRVDGLFDTFLVNTIVMNYGHVVDTTVFTPVNDDIFKRILTWRLYKGDGKQIDIRWLKRRIYRFLTGVNGTDPNAADTTGISVEFNDNTTVTISVIEDAFVGGGTLGNVFNTHGFNTTPFNQGGTSSQLVQTLTNYTHGNSISIEVSSSFVTAPVFKQAIEQGILEMPFQFNATVTIV